MSDPLTQLSEQLESLDERDIAEHPEQLEAAHRVLVAELDALAGGLPTPPAS